MNLLETIFLQPLYNALIALYNVLGDMGLAIIGITLVIRVIMLPLANKAFRSQRKMQALQPELRKLQEKHKDDREVMARELMQFYKREGVSPASSCLPLLLQIPILIALFFVFKDAVTGHPIDLYGFVASPGTIDTTFLGLIDLAKPDTTFLLPSVAAGLQFIQSRMLLPANQEDMPAITRQMTYLFPVLTFAFSFTLPGALPLYWAATTLFTVMQQYVIMKEMPLATAKAEAAKEWNEANPEDPVQIKKPSKSRKSKGAQVTVRKRGE